MAKRRYRQTIEWVYSTMPDHYVTEPADQQAQWVANRLMHHFAALEEHLETQASWREAVT